MNPQRAAALAFLAVSVAYLAMAIRIEEVVSSSAAVVGPRGFPLLVGSVGVLVSIVLLFARQPAAGDVTPGDAILGDAIAIQASAASARRGVFAGDWRRVLALCGLTLLYAATLPLLGFTLATAGFLAASFRLLGERRLGALIVVPLAIAVVCLALLRGALGAYLPEPLLERLL